MAISRADIERVASLARLHLTGEEVEHLASDLSRILEYVGKLGELDTAHVEPTSSVVAMSTPFREDVVSTGGDPEAAVANAPRKDEHYFVVPRIIE
jgi:aspartyl-tRNA(Asn)/glutamyl-tRNA(Gln) amidotransferase subunit C